MVLCKKDHKFSSITIVFQGVQRHLLCLRSMVSARNIGLDREGNVKMVESCKEWADSYLKFPDGIYP